MILNSGGYIYNWKQEKIHTLIFYMKTQLYKFIVIFIGESDNLARTKNHQYQEKLMYRSKEHF